MEQKEDLLKEVISHAKEYGFVFPSSEIYDGLSATYDYGQLGAELKNNIKAYWWKSMVQMHENIVGLDAAIFMHPSTWKASGHVDAFNDPLIDNKDSKKRYRADVLIEDHIEKYRLKIDKEVKKAEKRFGDDFDKTQFLATNPNVLRNVAKIDEIEGKMGKALEANDLEAVKALIEELGIACPVSGSKNWTEVRQFNLMFSTEMGSVAGDASKIYLRPETAQGIFVNFLNVQKSGRMKIPYGIAQIGKAFRNEIIAHYANAAADIEFNFPMGFKELEGIHSRTDFDLKQHEAMSGKKLQFFDAEMNKNYVPYVVETSIGLDRMFLAVLSSSLKKEVLEDESERLVMKIPAPLAPYKVAVMPLTKKDGLPDKARSIISSLKYDYNCQYDEKDSIGKRYRRQDAIGTPFSVTVDHESLENDTVTIRDRDNMEQMRVSIADLPKILEEKVSMNSLLKKMDA